MSAALDVRVILLDEHDWDYMGTIKEMQMALLVDAGFTVLLSVPGMIVLSGGAMNDPSARLRKSGVTADRMYIMLAPLPMITEFGVPAETRANFTEAAAPVLPATREAQPDDPQ